MYDVSNELLFQLCRPPQRPPSNPNWVAVEDALGLAVPLDLKELIEVYGPGAFNGFLWILQPSYENVNLDIVEVDRRSKTALARLNEEQTVGYLKGVSTQISRLTAWAITDNGDVCYWTDDISNGEGYVILVNEDRAPRWCSFRGSFGSFLCDVLTDRFDCSVFPDDLTTDGVFFSVL